MELFDQIGNIELKTRQLVKRLERLSSENTNLLVENKELKETQQSQQANIIIFKEKILNIKERFEGVEEIESEHLTQYLREIQQCVDWLAEQQ